MYISILHTAIMCSDALSTPILVQNTTLGGKVPLAQGKRPSPALEDNMPSVFEELYSIFPTPPLKCYAKPWEVNSIYTWKSKTHRDKISLMYLQFRKRENKACLFYQTLQAFRISPGAVLGLLQDLADTLCVPSHQHPGEEETEKQPRTPSKRMSNVTPAMRCEPLPSRPGPPESPALH